MSKVSLACVASLTVHACGVNSALGLLFGQVQDVTLVIAAQAVIDLAPDLPALGTTLRKPNDIGSDYRFLTDGVNADEIEHRSTSRIDDAVSAKLQACCINFNESIKKLYPAGLGELNSGKAIATRLADWLWFREIGFERVFATRLAAQWIIGLACGLAVWQTGSILAGIAAAAATGGSPGRPRTTRCASGSPASAPAGGWS
mgnify:CR=1 FL=1